MDLPLRRASLISVPVYRVLRPDTAPIITGRSFISLDGGNQNPCLIKPEAHKVSGPIKQQNVFKDVEGIKLSRKFRI